MTRRACFLFIVVLVISTAHCRVTLSNEALHTVRHTPQRRQLDIVVSHFDEDLEGVSSYIDTLRQLPNIASRHSTVWLYTKGSDSQEALANISAWVKPDHIFHLLNIGREGHTYLTHITETYHDLAEFTIFIQASVHSLELTLSRLRGMFTQHTGVLALGDVWTCSCDGCYLPQERLASQRDIYSLFSNTFCPGEVTVFAHGMFLVSSRRVQQHSLDKYMLIKSMFEAPSGHFIHKGAVDLSSPDFGHVIERSWAVMFGCGDVEVAQQCCVKNILELPVQEGQCSPDSCQCMDRVVDVTSFVAHTSHEGDQRHHGQ